MVRLAGESPYASPVSAGGALRLALSPGTVRPWVIAAAAAVQVLSSARRAARFSWTLPVAVMS